MTDSELVGTFDARVWAREFIARTAKDQDIATDEDAMLGWFANAIMSGYDEAQRRAAPHNGDTLSPSEALYAFMAWLTTRRERTTLSAADDAAVAAGLVAEFCKHYELSEPREGWHRHIQPMASQESATDDGKQKPR